MCESVVLDDIDPEILRQLSPRSASACATVCKSWMEPAVEIVQAAYEAEFEAAMPCLAARKHLVRLLGCPSKSAKAAFEWRKQTAKRAQKLEMLQGGGGCNIDKSIGAARLEGGNIFAACKRAMLCSEEDLIPSRGANGEVEQWMKHIVEAVDSRCFKDSLPAWRWFAQHELLEDGSVRWIVELAHSLDTMKDVASLVREFPMLREQVEAYAISLTEDPKLGMYSHDRGRIRDRDVHRLLETINRARG